MVYKQGLETVIRAADLAASQPHLRFVLQGDGSQRADLVDLAERLGVRGVSFLPLASDTEFPNIVRAADVLLLNQRGSVRNMSMPGKLGTYFAAGLPVVAAVSSRDETAREVASAGAGLVVEPDNPAALLGAVEALRGDPKRAAALGGAGRRYAACHLSEASFVEGVRGFLEAAMSSHAESFN
jgi:glycosyltransferase involved in cell wall biosynthesis